MIPDLKPRLWISTSIILGSILLAAGALYFTSGAIGLTSKKIMADKAIIQEQTSALAVLAALKEQGSHAVEYQTAMEKLIPTQDGLIGFGQWISDIAAQYSVTANVVFTQAIQPPSGATPGQAGFSITANGSVDNLVAFLGAAEAKPGFPFQIVSFDLIKQNPDYELSGQGELFFR